MWVAVRGPLCIFMYIPEVLRCGYALMCTSFKKLETGSEGVERGRGRKKRGWRGRRRSSCHWEKVWHCW